MPHKTTDLLYSVLSKESVTMLFVCLCLKAELSTYEGGGPKAPQVDVSGGGDDSLVLPKPNRIAS